MNFSAPLLLMITSLSLIIMSLASLLAKKSTQDREKSSPFECGFDPKSSARMPFSLRFFLITVIFLIFDVEITLLLPIPLIINSFSHPLKLFTVSIIFLIILLGGLLYEWKMGALEWAS